MNMISRVSITIVLFFVLNGSVSAQNSNSHELSLGVGLQFPNEKTPLNVPGDNVLPSTVTGNAAYRVYLSELVAVGVRGTITSMKLGTYLIVQGVSSAVSKADFSLSEMNAGLESQIYLSSRGHIRPYLSLQILYAEQNLTSTTVGNLKGQGYLAGGGPGVRLKVSESVRVSAEALYLAGSAEWKQKPFSNSSGTEFDPSNLRAQLNISFLIQ
ncbi:MAG: hypothetical protein KA247_04645 [Bacteroidetes bacterium]|nr:hypothetical protein [Bacteroidota bacterium]